MLSRRTLSSSAAVTAIMAPTPAHNEQLISTTVIPFTQSRSAAVERIFASLAAILLSVMCAGCWVQSVYPFYDESDVVVDNALRGSWEGLGELSSCDLNIALETSTRTYTITVSKSPSGSAVQCESLTFEGKMLQLGRQRFLDIAPDPEKSGQASLDTILKLDVTSGNLALTPLDPDWNRNRDKRKNDQTTGAHSGIRGGTSILRRHPGFTHARPA